MKRLWTNARIATLAEGAAGLGVIERGGILADGEHIVWVDAMADLPDEGAGAERFDLEGRRVTPGLIDCHTHLVHGGDRAREFEMRLEGASYEDIARAGGGIISSVTATRAASPDELVVSARPRLDRLIAEGVTTIEIKSCYGLDLLSELKMLRAARALGHQCSVSVTTTCLSAHAVPPEFKENRAAYLDLVVDAILPAMVEEGLVDAVDAFMEGIAFSGSETARVFDRAWELGLPVKLHADQLSNLHGAKLAAKFGALSADHLEYTDEESVAAMAASGTVAVLLPGAFYTLGETQVPPVTLFRRHGVPMAVATDANPGTSPMTSLLLTMNMAATLFRMRVGEVIAGATREAARLAKPVPSKRASPAIWRSGTSRARQNLSTGSGSTPCTSAFGGTDNGKHHPGAGQRPTLCMARSLFRCRIQARAGCRTRCDHGGQNRQRDGR